jgi:hypothetical protein
MPGRFAFYQRHGVQEYVVFDPYMEDSLGVWVRRGGELSPAPAAGGWTSPVLGVRFHTERRRLVVTPPDDRRFVSYRDALREQYDRMDTERAATRVERLAAKLRELGVDPDSV